MRWRGGFGDVGGYMDRGVGGDICYATLLGGLTVRSVLAGICIGVTLVSVWCDRRPVSVDRPISASGVGVGSGLNVQQQMHSLQRPAGRSVLRVIHGLRRPESRRSLQDLVGG